MAIRNRKFALVKIKSVVDTGKGIVSGGGTFHRINLACGHAPLFNEEGGKFIQQKMNKDKNSFFRCYECRIPKE